MKLYIHENSFMYLAWNLIILLLLSLLFNNLGIFFVGIIGIVIVQCCANNIDNKTWKIITICTTIALIWMVLQYYGLIERFDKPYYAGDDENYEKYGKLFFDANAFLLNQAPEVHYTLADVRGYFWVVSWIMRVCSVWGEFHTITPRLINVYLWMSSSILVYKMLCIEDTTLSDNLAKKVLVCLSIFPNALYISSFVYRDAFCIFLIVVFLYCYRKIEYKIRQKSRMHFFELCSKIAICIISIYILFVTRKVLLFLIGSIAIIDFFLYKKSKNIILLRIILLITVFIVAGSTLLFERIMNLNNDYSHYILNTLGYSKGMSGVIFSKPILPFGIFLRAAWGLMCPFPGGILQQSFLQYPLYSAQQTIVYMGTIVQLLCLPLWITGLKRNDANAINSLLAYFMVTLTTFTFRHFILFYPFLAIEIYYGLKQTTKKQLYCNFSIISMAILAGTIVYVVFL